MDRMGRGVDFRLPLNYCEIFRTLAHAPLGLLSILFIPAQKRCFHSVGNNVVYGVHVPFCRDFERPDLVAVIGTKEVLLSSRFLAGRAFFPLYTFCHLLSTNLHH
jgi:hypothetical protein